MPRPSSVPRKTRRREHVWNMLSQPGACATGPPSFGPRRTIAAKLRANERRAGPKERLDARERRGVARESATPNMAKN